MGLVLIVLSYPSLYLGASGLGQVLDIIRTAMDPSGLLLAILVIILIVVLLRRRRI